MVYALGLVGMHCTGGDVITAVCWRQSHCTVLAMTWHCQSRCLLRPSPLVLAAAEPIDAAEEEPAVDVEKLKDAASNAIRKLGTGALAVLAVAAGTGCC